MLDGFLNWLASLPAVARCAVLMALSALENVFPPVPADVAVVLGAFLAQRSGRSVALMGFLCWAANTGSSAALYFYARSRGRAWLRERTGRAQLMPPDAVLGAGDRVRAATASSASS